MGMSVEKVREIMKVAQEPVSLETPIGEEEDSHLGDFIPDEDAPAPAEAASHTLLREQLGDVLRYAYPAGGERCCVCASGLMTGARARLKRSARNSTSRVNVSARSRQRRCAS